MRRILLLSILVISANGCGNHDECEALGTLLREQRTLLERARSQAKHRPRFEQDLKRQEAETEAFLAKHAIGEKDEGYESRLRTALLPLAPTSFDRTTIASEDTKGQTAWVVKFAAPNFEQTWTELARLLGGTEPVLALTELARDPKSGALRLTFVRPSVERTDFEARPVALPELRSASQIPSKFGFCGAGDLRAELAQIAEEYARLRPDAERTSVLMPELVTRQGIKRRAKLLIEQQRETARLMSVLVSAARTAKLPVKGLGFEDPLVVVALVAKEGQRPAFEAALEKRLVAALKPLQSEAGVLRLGLPNEVSRTPRRGVDSRFVRPSEASKRPEKPAPAADGGS